LFAILQFDILGATLDTQVVKKSGKFVFGAILGIAFFVSLGSVRAFAVSDEDMNPKDDVSPLDVAGYDSKIHQYEIAPSRWAIGIRAAADGIPLGSSAGNSLDPPVSKSRTFFVRRASR
jgi:hypothetical protein